MKLPHVSLLIGLLGAPASSAFADSTVLTPLAMEGPYKSEHDACVHATPCGFTKMDPKNQTKFISPPKVATCGDGTDDINNGADAKGVQAKLDHKVGDLAIQIASQVCAMPPGIRWEHNVYYAFVKRTDGWWRSAPLWQFNYNDKYEGGSMLVRWNDQPGRTFAGVMARLDSGACMKHGSSAQTVEMMLRFEPGPDGKAPIVFGPLVVGERFSRTIDKDNPPEPGADTFDCKPVNKSFELDEKWSGEDALELDGPASWFGIRSEDGLLEIVVTDTETKPSSAGKYRFSR